MTERYLYVHDGYGNEAFETTDPQGEWESLKELGGDWAEIGELSFDGSHYYNEAGEIVFQLIDN